MNTEDYAYYLIFYVRIRGKAEVMPQMPDEQRNLLACALGADDAREKRPPRRAQDVRQELDAMIPPATKSVTPG